MLCIVSIIVLCFSIQHTGPKHNHRFLDPKASILRAVFSGADAAVLLKPESLNASRLSHKNAKYIGKVVPTHQQSMLVRVDENANTTDVFTGSFRNAEWIIWNGYWTSASTRTTDSKIVVFVDMVEWLSNYNITLRGDFSNISDWKAWHEASFIFRDK